MKALVYIVLGICVLLTLAAGLWPLILTAFIFGAVIEAIRMAIRATR